MIAGVVYDIISSPGSVGYVQDEATGAWKPEVFLQWRVNGQYIYEGLAAGAMFSLGGAGFMMLDLANKKDTLTRNRHLLILAAGVSIFVAYNLSIVFLKKKIHGYMR